MTKISVAINSRVVLEGEFTPGEPNLQPDFEVEKVFFDDVDVTQYVTDLEDMTQTGIFPRLTDVALANILEL